MQRHACAACCGRWPGGPLHLQAPTAGASMRSRCSACVRELGASLQGTWHRSTRPTEPPAFETGLRWLGLEVERHTPLGDDAAEVRFVARSRLGGRAHGLQECSRFARADGHWYCCVDGR